MYIDGTLFSTTDAGKQHSIIIIVQGAYYVLKLIVQAMTHENFIFIQTNWLSKILNICVCVYFNEYNYNVLSNI